jgi:hypothetical protein
VPRSYPLETRLGTSLANVVAKAAVTLSKEEDDNEKSEVAHLIVLAPLPLQASVVVEATEITRVTLTSPSIPLG